MTASSLTVVLPAYNEEARLDVALDELFGYLRRRGAAGRDGAPGPESLPASIDVLIVDDGSTDRTAELVRSRREYGPGVGPRLALLSVPHGGKGSAVRAGMLAATGEVAIFADADMATPPDQLPLVARALERADVALGSRLQPDGRDMRRSQPVYRRLLGRTFHALASIWVTGPVRDTQCGFKGFRLAVAKDLFARQRIRSIVFDVEIIYLARRRGYRIDVVPVQWSDKHGSRMAMRAQLAAQVGWDLFRIPLIHRSVERTSGSAARALTGEETDAPPG